MAGDPDIAALNRTMKDVANSLKDMTRVLTALNANVVGIYKNFSEEMKEVLPSPRNLGWKIADQLEAAGELIPGDIKVHSDGLTLSVWKDLRWMPV